jgi:hypothetical protein
MGVCWWCYWGWPKEIRDIYDDAVQQLGMDDSALRWGPAHIVWEDENWDSAQWCLENFETYADRDQYSDDALSVVRESLKRLVALPNEFKHEPVGYDDENPKNYPPPSHWKMKRVQPES